MTQQSIGMTERGRNATQQSTTGKARGGGARMDSRTRGQNERINTTISRNRTSEVMCF